MSREPISAGKHQAKQHGHQEALQGRKSDLGPAGPRKKRCSRRDIHCTAAAAFTGRGAGSVANRGPNHCRQYCWKYFGCCVSGGERRGRYPLAINSHFFEFIDSDGQVFTTETLREREKYEIVVTTAGGLWRYRVGDHVIVTGFMEKTPSLKFIGRSGDTSDLFGEKLSETFVNEAFREVFGCDAPRFALLAPDEQAAGCGYTLYVEGMPQRKWAASLDCVLCRNPQYAYHGNSVNCSNRLKSAQG